MSGYYVWGTGTSHYTREARWIMNSLYNLGGDVHELTVRLSINALTVASLSKLVPTSSFRVLDE